MDLLVANVPKELVFVVSPEGHLSDCHLVEKDTCKAKRGGSLCHCALELARYDSIDSVRRLPLPLLLLSGA